MFKNLKQTYIISELGINANGDLELLTDMIQASKEAGADCVKLQKRDLDLVYTPEELASARKSKWGDTFRQQKEGLEFNRKEYEYIDEVCKRVDIQWTASPWDINSLNFLMDFNVPYIKIPSALATDKKYLEECAYTRKPLILSTGMCDLKKIQDIVWFLEDHHACLEVIMHCVSTYPTKVEEMNLMGVKTLANHFARMPYIIGHSGHDELLMSSAIAVALGAEVIERHFTMSKGLEGSDQKASLEPDEFAEMVRKIRLTEAALGNGAIVVYDSEKPIAAKLRKVDDFV